MTSATVTPYVLQEGSARKHPCPINTQFLSERKKGHEGFVSHVIKDV